MIEILAICGSTRAQSSNLNLIKAISELAKDKFEITVFEGLAELPHFNPDLDNEFPPIFISEFRNKLRNAEGILICTPEYAMGVPGTLKNAIDWTVSSMEFSNKPTALITASSVGKLAHQSLLETLKVIEAKVIDETQLLISFVKTKKNSKAEITDTQTFQAVKNLINSFETSILEQQK